MNGTVAIIVLQIVNAPLRKGRGVDKLVLEASGITRAGMSSGTGIDTEFKTF